MSSIVWASGPDANIEEPLQQRQEQGWSEETPPTAKALNWKLKQLDEGLAAFLASITAEKRMVLAIAEEPYAWSVSGDPNVGGDVFTQGWTTVQQYGTAPAPSLAAPIAVPPDDATPGVYRKVPDTPFQRIRIVGGAVSLQRQTVNPPDYFIRLYKRDAHADMPLFGDPAFQKDLDDEPLADDTFIVETFDCDIEVAAGETLTVLLQIDNENPKVQGAVRDVVLRYEVVEI